MQEGPLLKVLSSHIHLLSVMPFPARSWHNNTYFAVLRFSQHCSSRNEAIVSAIPASEFSRQSSKFGGKVFQEFFLMSIIDIIMFIFLEAIKLVLTFKCLA